MSKIPENSFARRPSDLEIESRARAIFRAACEGTDSRHAAQLGSARRKALVSATSRQPLRWLAPLAGSAVACCALAIGIVVLRPAAPSQGLAMTAPASTATAPSSGARPLANAADEPDVASNQMDMVQNLDFYQWLAAQPTVASVSGGGSH